MARTYKTLALSLRPDVFRALHAIGKKTGRTGARVAAEIVLCEIAKTPEPKDEARRRSWCCHGRIVPVQGQLVVPETSDGKRRWVPVIVLLCATRKKQMHRREYEGWIVDA